ncbi:MAG: V-type ATPase subunit [Endomicrobiia bacterium]
MKNYKVNLDYAYPVARIHTLETKLLTKKNIEELINLPDGRAVVYFLNTIGYGTKNADINTMVAKEIENTFNLVESITPEYDRELIRIFREIDKPQLDKWNYFLKISKKNDFIHDFLRVLIDITNIKLLFQFKFFNVEQEILKKSLISNGTIPLDFFIENYSKPWENIINQLKFTKYDFINRQPTEENLFEIEKIFDNYIIDYLSDNSKYCFFNIAPLVNFIFLKKFEAQMILTIWHGKLNEFSKESILTHLRKIYV